MVRRVDQGTAQQVEVIVGLDPELLRTEKVFHQKGVPTRRCSQRVVGFSQFE